ncbi:MAG: LysM peptidoglycan-binding domain-containing protein, partial [Acidobacteria bacterium]|nr:LysM peptidoglycan-binding domain-containing protein [Acidobacteriota bacterium]
MRGRFVQCTRWLVAIAAFLMVWTGEVAGGEEADHPAGPHRPPAAGRWVGDHWTPYEPPDPETFGEGGQAYRIVRNDTLWDLAGRFFSDPYLWPHIWDANRYILDSHWIYPGDPLLIPGRPTVVTEVLPQVEPPAPAPDAEPAPEPDPETEEASGARSGPAASPARPEAPRPAPAPGPVAYADLTDLECLG